MFNRQLGTRFTITALIVILCTILPWNPASAAPNGLVFPVLGGGSFSNDFNAPRTVGGIHHATDIFAPKHTPIVSPVEGTVYYVMYPQPSWGYSVGIRDDDGYEYNFLHINNDNDGTDDGAGGPMKAYAYDMKVGNRVVRGQHLGWLGDSGNAETTPPHLHFEIYAPNGSAVNPYDYLVPAVRINQVALNPNAQSYEILPYGPYTNASVQMAVGNLDQDPQQEYVTGAGAGGGPHVRVFNANNTFDDYGFFAYDSRFNGGVNVAAGDVDGDGVDEIITGTGPNSSTHVRIFEKNGQYIGGFFAYDGFYTGVNVTAGDVDGDGVDEIITGTGPNSSSYVKVFKPNGQLVNVFEAYPGYYVGSDVGAGDVDGDGQIELVTSPVTGSTHVKTFKPNGILETNFFAYPGFYGGTRIDVGNVRTNSARAEIVTAPYSNGGPDIRLYDQNGSMITRIGLYENWWSGGYDVGAGTGQTWVGTGGNRRASIRLGPS